MNVSCCLFQLFINIVSQTFFTVTKHKGTPATFTYYQLRIIARFTFQICMEKFSRSYLLDYVRCNIRVFDDKFQNNSGIFKELL